MPIMPVPEDLQNGQMPAMCPCPKILKRENASLPNTKEDEICSF